jgi:hypothetical protein
MNFLRKWNDFLKIFDEGILIITVIGELPFWRLKFSTHYFRVIWRLFAYVKFRVVPCFFISPWYYVYLSSKDGRRTGELGSHLSPRGQRLVRFSGLWWTCGKTGTLKWWCHFIVIWFFILKSMLFTAMHEGCWSSIERVDIRDNWPIQEGPRGKFLDHFLEGVKPPTWVIL